MILRNIFYRTFMGGNEASRNRFTQLTLLPPPKRCSDQTRRDRLQDGATARLANCLLSQPDDWVCSPSAGLKSWPCWWVPVISAVEEKGWSSLAAGRRNRWAPRSAGDPASQHKVESGWERHLKVSTGTHSYINVNVQCTTHLKPLSQAGLLFNTSKD